MLVVLEDLFAELVDELVEAEVHLGLYLVVEELLLEVVQGIVGTVTVQVQRVQDVPGGREGEGGGGRAGREGGRGGREGGREGRREGRREG